MKKYLLLLGLAFLSLQLYQQQKETIRLFSSFLQEKDSTEKKVFFSQTVPPDKQQCLQSLQELALPKDILLNGANICIKDRGLLYYRLAQSPYAKKRICSHKQKKGSSMAISHLLFYLDEEGNTRLQVENAPLDGFKNIIIHSLDYLKYILTNKQQGPLGSCKHTEDNPIYIP